MNGNPTEVESNEDSFELNGVHFADLQSDAKVLTDAQMRKARYDSLFIFHPLGQLKIKIPFKN